MKFLLVLLGLVTLTAAQFNQPRFSPRRSFGRFDDDDFDDFFDIDDDFHDSLEDLYEDLYDDDADDRAEARAKLTRLRASGAITGSGFKNSRFLPSNNRRTAGFRQSSFNNNNNRGFGGSQRFNTQRPRTSFTPARPAFNTQRPAFNTQRPAFNTQRPAFNTQRPAFNTQRPAFNTKRPAFNTARPSTFRSSNSGFRSAFPQNRFSNNNNDFTRSLPSSTPAKRTFGPTSSSKFGSAAGTTSNDFNTINTGTALKSTSNSPFKSMPSGFTWPGGNGYYFSMSTNGAKPVTYFISFDD